MKCSWFILSKVFFFVFPFNLICTKTLKTVCPPISFLKRWNTIFAGSLMTVKEPNLNSLPCLSCTFVPVLHAHKFFGIILSHTWNLCVRITIYQTPYTARPRHTAEMHWLLSQSTVFPGLHISYRKTHYKTFLLLFMCLSKVYCNWLQPLWPVTSRITHFSPTARDRHCQTQWWGHTYNILSFNASHPHS